MKIIKIQDNQPRLLKIYYDLSNLCNYDCWYCFPESHAGTSPWPDVEVIKHNIVHLVKHYRKNSNINNIEITFLGGEPTLWKHLGALAKFIKSQVECRICILTNGSRTLRWWEEYADYFDQIGISVHHEKADIDHVINVSNILYNKKINSFTAVLMDHTNWDKCIDIVDKLSKTKKKWTVLAKPIHIDGVNNYNKEQLDYLKNQVKRYPSFISFIQHYKVPRMKYKVTKENGEVFTTKTPTFFSMNMLHHYEGWDCNLGVNFLSIDRAGIISGTCKQKLYGLDYYFNLNDTDFVEKYNPAITGVICEQKICMCSGEAALTKRKI
jgi:wyosine [tRNA(Phe)-imidazoG37] synthetase (radical SAM superfamily)